MTHSTGAVRFRTVGIALAVLSALCALSPFAAGLATTALVYKGACYGFADQSFPCSWWSYAQTEILLAVPLAGVAAMAVGLGWCLALVFRHVAPPLPGGKALRVWQVILVFFVSSLGGAFVAMLIALAHARR